MTTDILCKATKSCISLNLLYADNFIRGKIARHTDNVHRRTWCGAIKPHWPVQPDIYTSQLVRRNMSKLILLILPILFIIPPTAVL